MSKYAIYVHEREGAETYEDHRGFFTYVVNDGIFQVNDLFVLPGLRNRGIGKEFADLIEAYAKEDNCRMIVCTTCTDAKNWEQSEAYIKAHGYAKIKEEGTLIYYKKEL